MEPEPARFLVTPHFLGSLRELPDHCAGEVLTPLRLFLADPGKARLDLRSPAGGAASVHTIWSGDSRRILFSGEREMKLLFAGDDCAAIRFARSVPSDVTAFAEAPVAFQLHIDFWQAESVARFETPSSNR